MSAFIVSPETIDNILNYLYFHRHSRYMDSTEWLLRKLQEMTGIDTTGEDWPTKLGNALYELNVKAVNYRYNDDNKPLIGKFSPGYPKSIMQTLKSLQCLSYQCCEGKYPETQLYKWMEVAQHSLMSHIVSNLPEYNKAVWG